MFSSAPNSFSKLEMLLMCFYVRIVVIFHSFLLHFVFNKLSIGQQSIPLLRKICACLIKHTYDNMQQGYHF